MFRSVEPVHALIPLSRRFIVPRLATLMKIADIAFTVIPVSNLAKARPFYEGVLKLKPTQIYEKDGMGMIEYDIGPGTLAIGAGAPLLAPSTHGAVISLAVEDFEEAIAELKQHGVVFKMEPIETPVCRMAMITDPDGSPLMLHKRK